MLIDRGEARLMNLENLTSKQLLALFYIFANIVSAIICGIILHKSNRNKNTRSRIYARILNFLNMYFVGDALWALGFFDIVHGASTILIISRIIYYSSAALIAYFWFMCLIECVYFVYKTNQMTSLFMRD